MPPFTIGFGLSAWWRKAVLLVFAASASLAQTARPKPVEARTPAAVAIFYDGATKPLAEGYLDARHIQNLLGHFRLSADVFPLAEYRRGALARYRVAFFIGTISGTRFPEGFLEDVRGSQRPFCWIGRHIGSLLESEDARRQFGFRYVDYRDDLEFSEVLYKGVSLPKEDPDLNFVEVTDGSAVQVLATARNDEKQSRPYALRRGRFWYFADTPFSYVNEGGRYLVFCDLLHDILEIEHAPQAQALARIEDVSAEIDPLDLRRVADRLAARGVPFQIALVPVFRNPARGVELYLSDRPALVEAIQYMITRGGAPVLHGVTHQYRGASGDDYEFWDELLNRPIARDLPELVSGRLQLGLAECFANGIIPMAFETPHYAASETDYQAMQQVFSVFNERTMPTPDFGSIQYFPYPVVDRFGRYVVPENLGYLPLADPDPKVLIQAARNLRVVRDAVASFYFHPFLNPDLLMQVVQGVTEAGYRFVSLREFGGDVDYRGRYVVRSASGTARLRPEDEYWRLRLYDRSGKLVRQQVSSGRQTGPVEVAVDVPAGGWAAFECLKDLPREIRAAQGRDWTARVREWWTGLKPKEAAPGLGGHRQAWLLWLEQAAGADAHNQQSYRTALETFGYQVRLVQPAEFRATPTRGETILIIPQGAGSRLSSQQQQQVLRYLAASGSVVADGRQAWLSQLGFHWTGRRVPVSTVVDVLYPEISLQWRPEEFIDRFEAPPDSQQLAVDFQSRQILAVAGRHGTGHYIYLAAPLDPYTPDAVSHYPYFAEYLAETFRHRRAARSPQLEVYFDPGFREGVNLDRLASSWRQAGIRTVYVAAWHFYPRYTFDYANFIRLCHRQGLTVYAWFIPPAVTPLMWDQHPEWRERAASGGDGRAGWRYAMNLENAACFRAAMDWMKGVIQAHPWDGANISELNYDADFTNYLRPDRFVPMNDDVRAAFRREAGFDPAELFEPSSSRYHKRNAAALGRFLRFREDIVTQWHRRLLGELEPLRRAGGWEMVVTMLDSLHSQYVQPALGLNSRRIVDLMREFDFTLQVEDPAEHWATPPDRYLRFAETYRRLVPEARRRLMFDVNVMPNRNVAGTSLPSATATGMELARTIAAAASVSGRVAVYSEYTVPHRDWPTLGAALARSSVAEASGGGWKVDSKVPVLWTTVEDEDYLLDGRRWPVVSTEGLLVPPGPRRLSLEATGWDWLSPAKAPARIVHLSGELLDARAESTGVMVRYWSPGRGIVVLSRRPLEIRVDGEKRDLPVEAAAGGNWAVVVPRGEHRLEATTITQAGIVLNVWSWASASTIVVFGTLTTVLMAALYVHIRVGRLARRRGTS